MRTGLLQPIEVASRDQSLTGYTETVKATDENLTSENWEYILNVCDLVSDSPSGPQQAVASLIKRLAHRNANVQLYTLEVGYLRLSCLNGAVPHLQRLASSHAPHKLTFPLLHCRSQMP